MADTLTPYLSLVKPLVGDPEGEDLWGDKLNGNFDLLDQFAAKQGALVEAPQDGKVYGRGTPTNWQEVPLKTDYDDLAVSVGQNSNSIEVLESEMDTKAPLGPDDGAIYGWKDTAWFQLSGSGGFTITWDQITEKPATYPPTLPIPSSGVTGLDAKQSSQDAAIAAINWNSLSGKPPTYPPTLPIPESGVTNLVADLAARPLEAPNDGAQYARQSLTWVKVTGGATIADTAPASPLPNSFWWSSLDGTLYIRYDDGSSAQWCQIVGQQGPAGPAGPTGADSTVPGPQGPAGAQGAPGATGAAGAAGATGAQGPAGQGVPAGGTTAQVLAKTSNADYATQWVASAPAVGLVDIGDTAPASPVDRQLYWSSTTGKLFIRYNDGNSTAWVQVNAWPSVSGFMPLTGGVFTGPVAIQTANWGTAFSLTATDATGAALLFNRGATPKTRWNMQMDSAAESGSNVGSDFYIWRYNDAGTTNIDAPLRITRSTGQVYMPNVAAGTYSLLGQSCYWSSDAGYTTFMMNTNCYLQYSKVNGNLYWTVNSVAQCVWTYNGTGSHLTITANAYKPGGGVWADSSDARIKNVQGDYELGLDEVIQLRPVRYTFKGNDTPEDPEADKATVAPFVGSPHFGAATDGTGYVGLIAQEVETVFPEMVTQRAAWIDGEQVSDMRDLDTNQLIFALVNAVKTLEARVRELEAVG